MFPVGRVERAVAKPVIGAGKGDDTRFAGGQQGGFERGFDGFKSGIAENGLGGGSGNSWFWVFGFEFRPPLEGEAAELAGEPRLERMGMHVAHRVQQGGHLTLPGPDHARIGVARGRDAESGGQVQILFPLRVPDVDAASPLPDDWPRTVRRNASDVPRFVIAEQLQNLAGAHASAPTLPVPFARRKTTACAWRRPDLRSPTETQAQSAYGNR